MGLSTFVVYAGGYVFLVFIAICLATGLYYMAEVVEEYTKLTKKVISYAIQAVLVLHVLIWVVDRLPAIPVLTGMGAHVLYFRLLRTFPFISLTSPDFLGSIATLVLSHAAWLRYFLYHPDTVHVTLEYLVGFFIVMVWLVPFAFFMSLAANESVLPSMGISSAQPSAYFAPASQGESSGSFAATGRRSRSLLIGLLQLLKRKRDEVLPLATQRIPSQYASATRVQKSF
eukprot:jgi/Chlat1/440/Chrsp103S01019